ncbi:MAG TPA: heavy-metal-associated domain-containing protein [Ferruginibacter sp.]|nr:heavy-metal-associated domain-containing protein [Ferruginibacter sp.]HPH90632.1 heavy-metal-associated domain-containing protein [Ferruginibacter sp.]
MKSISLTVLSFFAFIAMGFAQSQKVEIKTPGVQCEMCKTKIENYLMKREPGITAVKVDIKKKTTTVTFLKDRNNIEQVKTAIANAGYDADDVTAEEDAYKRLPKCCKKPVEATPAVEAAPAEKKE